MGDDGVMEIGMRDFWTVESHMPRTRLLLPN
jgi:hypothetical protein